MKRVEIVVGLLMVWAAQTAFAGVGSKSLTDASGLEYFINDDVTFTTSSMNSGAASDASYTTSVAATTSGGGTTMTVLSNAFDGYNNLFVNGTAYNMNGAATLDGDCSNRQFLFAEQTIDGIKVSRKVYVPDDDEFCRWMNIFTNDGETSITVTVIIANNLGSGTRTVVADTSAIPAAATTADNWVVSFEDYMAGVSPSPRLGHIFQGPHPLIGIDDIHFVTGDDQPYWQYSFNIGPGATGIILNYVTGQPSKAAARSKCQELVALPPHAKACMTDTELSQVINFDLTGPTVTMTSAVGNPTNVTPIPVTVTFSESVTGFDSSDITPTNGTVDNFSGSGKNYSFDLTPSGAGTVTADIAADAAVDAAGNGNEAAETFSRDFENVGPTVAMSSPTPDPTNIVNVIPVTVTFSKPVTGFDASDIIALNAKFGNFSGSGDTYYFTLTPLRIIGTVGADIHASVCTDEAGNPNFAAEPFRRDVRPVQACFNGVLPKQAGTTASATLGEALPLGAALLTLLGLGLGRRMRGRGKKD